MLLSEKIITLEDYLEARTPTGKTISAYLSGSGFSVPSGAGQHFLPQTTNGLISKLTVTEYIPKQLWWAHRELMRMAFGIYPEHTQALRFLSNQPPFQHLLVHVSKEDPSMIAFTASVDDGIRDRQTRMSLGRFMRKHYNFATDTAIAAVEAAHRTELNPPVEFIVAETHPDEFLNAYQAVGSCMSKDISAYGSRKMHPVLAYCTPGFQLAILRNSSGGVSARSLVWINPDDPEDKRYVRTYGDTVLQSYLTKNKFVPRSFEPAYLKTVAFSSGTSGISNLVCPYVDPGSHAAGSEQNARGVWDGGDRIYLLKSGTQVKVPEEYIVCITNSSGTTSGRAFPINRKCAITGKPINGMTDRFVDVTIDGKDDIALIEAVEGWVAACNAYGTKPKYHKPGTAVFAHGSTKYVDNDDNRHAMGYFHVDKRFYPEDDTWYQLGAEGIVQIGGNTKRFIRAEDVAIYIMRSGLVQRMHRDEIPKDAERVAAIEDVKTWASPEASIVRTVANRKVVPGAHPVAQMYNGEWNYTRHMRQVSFFAEKIWIPSDKSLATIELHELPPSTLVMITKACETLGVYGNAKKRALFDIFASRGDMLCPLRDGANGKLEAGYIFEYRSIPMKMVEAYLAADFDPERVVNAPVATMQMFHKFARLALVEFDKEWAKAHPKAATPVAESAETA